MKILHISDTHGKYVGLGLLPQADVLVHSGDFTMNGSDEEALDFLEWFCDLPYKHKIFIAGNHDGCMADASLEGLPENVHYLNNSGVTINGVSFYGVPMLAEVVDGEIRHLERYDLIDENVDVLVTHCPPLGILDSTDGRTLYGSSFLLARLSVIRPKMNLFGHVHEVYGTMEWKGMTFSNAAVTDSRYRLRYAPRLLHF